MEGEESEETITIETDLSEEKLHAQEPKELIYIDFNPKEDSSESEERIDYPNKLIHVDFNLSEDLEVEYQGILICNEDSSDKEEPTEEEPPQVENPIEHSSKEELQMMLNL